MNRGETVEYRTGFLWLRRRTGRVTDIPDHDRESLIINGERCISVHAVTRRVSE